MIHVFERPLLPGWVYPCTAEDLRAALRRIPEEHLAGLHAVGLAPSTRKDCSANARYYWYPRPAIHLFSNPDDLRIKLPPHVKRSHIELYCSVELAFGMRPERIGSRWFCCWDAGDLRRFILRHVLLHEIGHHVQRMHRLTMGYRPYAGEVVSEQFAEAYAIRMGREQSDGLPGAELAN